MCLVGLVGLAGLVCLVGLVSPVGLVGLVLVGRLSFFFYVSGWFGGSGCLFLFWLLC